MRSLLLCLLTLAAASPAALAGEPDSRPGAQPKATAEATTVVARHGKGRLERTADGRHILYLRGTPYEMGEQHGALLKDQVRRNVSRIYDAPGELGKKPEFRLYKLGRPLMHARLRPHIPPRFKEEMKGLAAGAGVDYRKIEAVNLFPAAFHCSGMALMGPATRDGSLYHVRILDYFTKLGLQDTALIVIVEPEGKAGYQRWMNVGFAGFVGTVTGMNEAQVTIGELGGRGQFHWNGVPMPMLMRDALERATTLQQAVEIFRTSKRTCEYYYVISDAKIPDARGVWATPHKIEFFAPGESYGFFEYDEAGRGAAGDKVFMRGVTLDKGPHHILVRSASGKQKGYFALPPKGAVVISGFDRYRCFSERLADNYGKVDAMVLQGMIGKGVSMNSNLHNAIFHPKTLTAWVAVAANDGRPGYDQTYHRYRLPPRAPRPAATEQTGR